MDVGLVGVNPAILEKIGIAGICVLVMLFGYRMFVIFMTQWKNSTDAVNNNTTAFMELSKVFEKANEREIEWQKTAMEVMKDTNKKVSDIHNKVV